MLQRRVQMGSPKILGNVLKKDDGDLKKSFELKQIDSSTVEELKKDDGDVKKSFELKQIDSSTVEELKKAAEAARQKAVKDLRIVLVAFQEGIIPSDKLIEALDKAGINYTINGGVPDKKGNAKNERILTFELDGKTYTFNLVKHDSINGHDKEEGIYDNPQDISPANTVDLSELLEDLKKKLGANSGSTQGYDLSSGQKTL